jgi:hypothetical protein
MEITNDILKRVERTTEVFTRNTSSRVTSKFHYEDHNHYVFKVKSGRKIVGKLEIRKENKNKFMYFLSIKINELTTDIWITEHNITIFVGNYEYDSRNEGRWEEPSPTALDVEKYLCEIMESDDDDEYFIFKQKIKFLDRSTNQPTYTPRIVKLKKLLFDQATS